MLNDKLKDIEGNEINIGDKVYYASIQNMLLKGIISNITEKNVIIRYDYDSYEVNNKLSYMWNRQVPISLTEQFILLRT